MSNAADPSHSGSAQLKKLISQSNHWFPDLVGASPFF
jgi:hypothetical protein